MENCKLEKSDRSGVFLLLAVCPAADATGRAHWPAERRSVGEVSDRVWPETVKKESDRRE